MEDLRDGFKYALISQLILLGDLAALIPISLLFSPLAEPLAWALLLAFFAALLAAAGLGVVGVYKLRRGYAAVLGKESWPARGVLLLCASLALELAAIFLFAVSWQAALGLYLASSALALLSFVLVFVFGTKELYDIFRVPELNKAFVLYLLFLLVVPVVLATWFAYRGLVKLAGGASANEGIYTLGSVGGYEQEEGGAG